MSKTLLPRLIATTIAFTFRAIDAPAATVEYVKLNTGFALGPFQNYSSNTGLTIAGTGPNFTVNFGGSANRNLTGQTAVSVSQTGSIGNGGSTTSDAAIGRVDLSTGELGVLGSSTNLTGVTGNRGQATAAMRDVVTLLNATGSTQSIDVYFSVNGAMNLPAGNSWATLRFRFCLGANCALQSNTLLSQGLEYLYTHNSSLLPDGNYLTMPTTGWNSVSFAPGTGPLSNVFHGVYAVPAGTRTVDLYASVAVDCGFNGLCDYQSGAKLKMVLPAGVSLTSDSGVLLSSSPPTGRRFVPVAPCRIADTRDSTLGAFGAPSLPADSTRSFAIPQKPGCNIPANAAAYSLNVTVVPKEPLGFLSIFPTGAVQPFVSTLNSIDARIKANAAMVPAGTGGAVTVYSTNATDVILDINGYFIDPAVNPSALAFYPLTPCRVADTRNSAGSLGGPALAAGTSRTFPVLASSCGVPANAQAYSLNATAVPPAGLGFLTLWAAGQPQPFVSTLNAPTGTVTANAAIVPAGTAGAIDAFVSSASHVVLDINGYFAPLGAANAQSFFPVSPCRLLDTRNATGEFGGPTLAALATRSYRLPLANCALPATAAAYSLNATVVPSASLGFLTLWPQGSAQPFVSTLNAIDGSIASNAALVPAGTSGGVSSYVNGQTHLILDTNGYFAP